MIPVTAGDYALNGGSVGAGVVPTSSNCFGAPMIHVEAGEYAYLGDASPFMGAKLSDGSKMFGMVYSRNFATAREAMAYPSPRHRGQDGRAGDLQRRDLFLRGGNDGSLRLARHGRTAAARSEGGGWSRDRGNRHRVLTRRE